MEKILVIINAHQPDMNTIDFACQIALMAKTHLTGLFIENTFMEYASPEIGVSYFSSEQNNRAVTADTEQTVRVFKEQCAKKGITAEILADRGEAIQEAIRESRFADLVVADPGTGFFNQPQSMPSPFIAEILSNAECPVLLAPKMYEGIDEVVFCYNGSASSVYAIKQFTYLFPELSATKVLLLEVNSTSKQEFDENDRRMMEWLRAYYHQVYYHSLNGTAKDELFTYFFMKRRKLVVMGAYGRSLLSQIFKKSHADPIIRSVDLPLFVSHH